MLLGKRSAPESKYFPRTLVARDGHEALCGSANYLDIGGRDMSRALVTAMRSTKFYGFAVLDLYKLPSARMKASGVRSFAMYILRIIMKL